MSVNSLAGEDIDYDRFLESLHLLADALDDGRAHSSNIEFGESVPGGGPAEFSLTIEYWAEGGDERLTNPIAYATEDEE